MYKQFVDTIEAPPAEEMPAEALKINGEYIENQMDSRFCKYRTLYVIGRESLVAEITDFETGVKDGTSILSKRYPAREIRVGYMLEGYSNYYFRLAYNQLCSILNVENAECIFYDEQDKYYIGTPTGLEEVDPGRNVVKGEFVIYCADPFKYAIAETEVEPESDGTFAIDYNGTYKAYPTLIARFASENECGATGSSATTLSGNADCGYVAWFNEDAKIIQIGNPDDDGDWSNTLVSQDFRQVTGWTTALNNAWSKNDGILYMIANFSGSTTFAAGTDGNYLTATDFGSGSKWHGTSVKHTVSTSSDFTAKWTMEFNIGNGTTANSNCNMVQVFLADSATNIIAGVNIYKGADDVSSKGKIEFIINNKSVSTKTVDLAYENDQWGVNGAKGNSITKSGDTVTFNLGGLVYSYTDSNLSSKSVVSYSINFAAYGTKARFPYMGVYDVTFVKNNSDDWADIPNKFTSNDTTSAVCRSGKILVNGAEAPEYGAVGNNWEDFYLKPGYNQIGFSWSSWTVNAPTTTLRYREVFL
ncbi:MAG: phage tail family protein [Bacteroidales bacterium]|nr:phage tail family protein [Bacteroidales bacterium]